MTITTDRAPVPVPICAECTSYFDPFMDGDLGVVVVPQEYLDQLIEQAFYRGFGEGLAQGLFGDAQMFPPVFEGGE